MCIVEMRPSRKSERSHEVVGASYPVQLVTLYEEEIRLHRYSSGETCVKQRWGGDDKPFVDQTRDFKVKPILLPFLS